MHGSSPWFARRTTQAETNDLAQSTLGDARSELSELQDCFVCLSLFGEYRITPFPSPIKLTLSLTDYEGDASCTIIALLLLPELVDAMAARSVLQPESLDMVVASNLLADILTDLGALFVVAWVRHQAET